jgi:hypothetical protein
LTINQPEKISMNQRIASAVFDSRDEAERAISELRSAGVNESAISIVGRHGEESTDGSDGDDDGVNKSGAIKGALAGAGLGGLLGVAALAIPGVGPLAAAGAIAASAAPEAAAIGAAVGATAGGLSGLFAKEGVDDDDARYYEDRVKQGGYFVGVRAEDAGVPLDTALDILYRNGGHSATRQRTAAV